MDMKSTEKYTLNAPMTPEDLCELMTQRWTDEMPGKFVLKKGLGGKSITFDVYMQIQPVVTVKGNAVTVKKMTNKTNVSVGGVGGDFKAMKEAAAALKDGGIKAAALGGQEYFNSVCDAIREVLKDRVVA